MGFLGQKSIKVLTILNVLFFGESRAVTFLFHLKTYTIKQSRRSSRLFDEEGRIYFS